VNEEERELKVDGQSWEVAGIIDSKSKTIKLQEGRKILKFEIGI